jgi:hypothetical protein
MVTMMVVMVMVMVMAVVTVMMVMTMVPVLLQCCYSVVTVLLQCCNTYRATGAASTVGPSPLQSWCQRVTVMVFKNDGDSVRDQR